MRLLLLGLALISLATCTTLEGSAHALNIRKTEDGALKRVPSTPDASGEEHAPSRTEEMALNRMENAIAAAEHLQHGEELSAKEREALLLSIERARAAVGQYRAARREKIARVGSLGMIGMAAAAIVTDDATVVGVADDPLLIPLALAAMAAAIRSNAPSARDELTRSWLELGHQLDELEQTIAMTSRGNVIHKHLVDEARERILREAAAAGTTLTNAQVTREMLCNELDRMMQEFRRSGNTAEWKKTISTQKGLNCRPSRNSRE